MLGNLRVDDDDLGQRSLFDMDAVSEPERVGLDDVPDPPRRRKVRRLRVVQPQLRNLDPGLEPWVERAETERPRTLGDCDRVVGSEPCPFVSCKMHLWSDEVEDGGLPRRMRWFEHMTNSLPPEEWGETCAMRVARGVVIVPSATGKHEAHSADGEPVGRPGPVLEGPPGDRRWVQHTGDEAAPRKVDKAVIGRFLGGLSREQARKDLNRAGAKCRADPEFRAWAVDHGLDPDALFEVDDD